MADPGGNRWAPGPGASRSAARARRVAGARIKAAAGPERFLYQAVGTVLDIPRTAGEVWFQYRRAVGTTESHLYCWISEAIWRVANYHNLPLTYAKRQKPFRLPSGPGKPSLNTYLSQILSAPFYFLESASRPVRKFLHPGLSLASRVLEPAVYRLQNWFGFYAEPDVDWKYSHFGRSGKFLGRIVPGLLAWPVGLLSLGLGYGIYLVIKDHPELMDPHWNREHQREGLNHSPTAATEQLSSKQAKLSQVEQRKMRARERAQRRAWRGAVAMAQITPMRTFLSRLPVQSSTQPALYDHDYPVQLDANDPHLIAGDPHNLDTVWPLPLNYHTRQMRLPSGPIKHVVVLFQENRSFSQVFGKHPRVHETPEWPTPPDPPEYLFAWDPTHGIASAVYSKWLRPREMYTRSHYPEWWYLADIGGLSVNHRSGFNTSSIPNHGDAIAGDAGNLPQNPQQGVIHDLLRMPVDPPFDRDTLFRTLQRHGYDWRNYGGGVHHYFEDSIYSRRSLPSEAFFGDLQRGYLPTFSWLTAPTFGMNEHPPDDPILGNRFVGQVVDALADSPLWENTLLIITHDESGGLADHQDALCGIQAGYPLDGKVNYHFGPPGSMPYEPGGRVPLVMVGPYVKPGYISHTPTTHASMAKFVLDYLGLSYPDGPGGERMARTGSLAEMVDTSQPPNPKPRRSTEVIAEALGRDLPNVPPPPFTTAKRRIPGAISATGPSIDRELAS